MPTTPHGTEGKPEILDRLLVLAVWAFLAYGIVVIIAHDLPLADRLMLMLLLVGLRSLK